MKGKHIPLAFMTDFFSLKPEKEKRDRRRRNSRLTTEKRRDYDEENCDRLRQRRKNDRIRGNQTRGHRETARKPG